MDEPRQRRILKLLRAALDLRPEERSEFLESECAGDSEVKGEVERLLALEKPALEQIVPQSADEEDDEAGARVPEERQDAVATEPTNADRVIVFGMLALQMGFIDQLAFIQAIQAWMSDKTRSMGSILLDQGALDARGCAAIDNVVELHIEMHNNSPRESLHNLPANDRLKNRLQQLLDPDIGDSVQNLGNDRRDDRAAAPGAALPDTEPSPRSLVYPGYEMLDEYAPRKGGIGVVYRVRDTEVDREVALKTLRRDRLAESNEEAAWARFVAEARISGNLEHPGIIPIYALGTDQEDHPFYVMRFVRGKTLAEVVRDFFDKRESLSPSERNLQFRKLLSSFVSVCQAVGYAHARAVIHRDLKPPNIMVGKHGDTLVLDWGLAKRLDDREDLAELSEGPVSPVAFHGVAHEREGDLAGTIEYMSPEQAAGKISELGPRSDVYALGATLYFVLAGKGPFGGFPDIDTRDETRWKAEACGKVQRGEFTPLQQVSSDLPTALAGICERAMHLEPRERFATAEGLGAAIEEWLAEGPTASYLAEVGHYRKLISESPNSVELVEGLSRSLGQLGLLYSGMSRTDEAETAFREAISALQYALRENPSSERVRTELATIKTSLARFYLSVGRKEEAAALRLEAARGFHRLSLEYPEDGVYVNLIASAVLVPREDGEYENLLERAARESELDTATWFDTRASLSEVADSRLEESGETGRYTLGEIAGSGGLGRVYVAYDHDLDRKVALKVAPPVSGTEITERLLAEARVAAGLEHPGIVPIYGLGRQAGTRARFISMRHIRGETLQEAIRRYHEGGRSLDKLRGLLRVVSGASRAIAFANSRGVIHRDPKPSNIMIDSFGNGIVVDWGTCKVLEDQINLGEVGHIVGTPLFMAPEQWEGDRVDSRTDVFVLGATLFNTLAGETAMRPDTCADFEEYKKHALKATRTDPREVLPDVDRRLAAICKKALARNPYDRYQTADELADDIERWLDGREVEAHPDGILARTARWVVGVGRALVSTYR